jgi:ketosteroid isomerase-like protein
MELEYLDTLLGMNNYEVSLPALESDVSPELRALVERQAKSWEDNRFALAEDDWLPDGVLVSPAGKWFAHELAGEMAKFHREYKDLVVTVKNVFATQDGSRLALEWDWTVTRRADGLRGTTPDAIIAELVDGKIKSWREYFDLSSSVEAKG